MITDLDDTPANLRLAIDGGIPVRKNPFPSWPCYSEEEISTALELLRSGKVNYWTGDQGRKFEQEFADYCGTKYAVAVANGSVALELALMALDIGPGDEVIVPSRTFIASATCAMVRGAVPVFADVDAASQNLTVESIRDVWSPRTRAIIAVHLAGWPCDMDPILEFARQHSLWVVEDCAQAHGATYRGRRVGSMGDIAAFSFCQDKIISTAGEGGMVVTNDATLFQRMWSYKDHGREWELSRAPAGPGFRWIHSSVGTNFRLTEMQSAIGRLQLRSLDEQLTTRRHNAAVLNQYLSGVPGIRVTLPPSHIQHAYYKYYAFIEPERLSAEWNRDRVLGVINAEGIPCTQGSCSEVYLEQAFAPGIRPRKRLEIARRLGETSLMFAVHPTLTSNDMQDICRGVHKVMAESTVANRAFVAA